MRPPRCQQGPDGQDRYRFWAVMRADEPVAVIDARGWLDAGGKQIKLLSTYAEHGRSVGRLVAAAAPHLLP